MKFVRVISIFAGFLVLSARLAASSPDDSAADLIGLWGCERSFGPDVRGELTIVERGSKWRAAIAGFEVPATNNGGALTLALPGDRGEFRGHFSKDGSSIVGHWIQPQAQVKGARYATPVELKQKPAKTWRGEVAPLDDHLSLYISIQRNPDGSIGAFLRNPDMNIGLRLKMGQVTRKGDLIHFAIGGGRELTGKFDIENAVFSLVLPYAPATFHFSRRSRDEAAGFYPRTPAEAYVYRQPLVDDDGWPTATLAVVGLDAKPVAALVERILATTTDSPRAPYIQSVLIARHGKLALDEYFYGFHKDLPHDARSASKTVASVLTGLAIDHGAPFDVSSSVYKLFPKYASFANDDARKRKITVENLLTMTAGYDCDENDDSSAGNEDTMQRQKQQRDWCKFTLDLPMKHEPGEKGLYCSAVINLLGGIVANTTKQWLPDFFHAYYAAPLEIARYHMNLTPTGEGYMGGGLYMRPRDFMKLGQLYLAGGRWKGRQVVSQQWVERSVQAHSSLEQPNDYGYTWHLNEYKVGGKTYRAYNAGGNGGQLVIVIPDLDLVVMFTAGNYGDYMTWSKFGNELVPQYVIPAAAGK